VVRWNARVASDRYAALLGSPRRRARDEGAAESLAARLEDLAAAGGLAVKLSEGGVDESALPVLAEQAARQWTGTFNPRPFDAAGALEIYRAAM
jgi:alcohol dehydrogenase